VREQKVAPYIVCLHPFRLQPASVNKQFARKNSVFTEIKYQHGRYYYTFRLEKNIAMKLPERNKVCSVESAGALDLKIRKLVHNPHTILKPFVKAGMTILDLGCGPGFFTMELARMVGKSGKVTAADLQEGMLDIVRKKVSGSDLQNIIEFHNCPDNKIGLEKTFDFILIFYMLHEVPDKSAFLHEVYSLVKSNGQVLIVEPRFHVTKSDFDDSEKIMKNIGFEIIKKPKVFFSRSVLLKRI
jgi:2-polyprenyl-3-methyl-5-hydroxy-6-metoxy-1,4-benzoquinol methylase